MPIAITSRNQGTTLFFCLHSPADNNIDMGSGTILLTLYLTRSATACISIYSTSMSWGFSQLIQAEKEAEM